MRVFSAFIPGLLAIVAAAALCTSSLPAQQTLGGITGEVTDASGGVIPNAAVTLTHEQTSVTRTARTNDQGTYTFVNLPIGTYTLTYTADGYEAQRTPHITVQADRTATLNVSLKVGQASTTVEVEAAPLMNAVDTTNGYVMETQQIDAVPLPTGSFTGLAILSPGVDAELPGGTGANSGLGNAPIWANGQRDTSNAFLLNGVDGSNLFNGKTTSQVDSFRVSNNTGQANNAAGGVVPSASSIYLAIGNAIPTPAPETLAEVRVNASMYDAQQGSSSGAHIDMSTKSGTNQLHGGAYVHRGTNWINAAPFFFKKDQNIPASDKNPQLHRYTAGGDLGGPLIKDKLFGFVSYQHLHISDQETGDELLDVPPGLNSGPAGGPNARGEANLLDSVNNNWTGNEGYSGVTVNSFNAASNPVGYALFTAPALPGEAGNYLIPSALPNADPNVFSPYNAFLPGTSRFTSDQAVADLDWNVTSKDVLAAKYYYQHDPSSAPYAYSNVPGFTAHMDTGSQVGSLNNVQTIGTSLSISETVGILREKAYATNDQPWAPGQAGTPAASMTSSFGSYFPGFTINDAIGDAYDLSTGPLYGLTAPSLAIGPNAEYQAANTGVFQNRIMPSGTAIWAKGRHSVSFGGSWSYTQLNTVDHRTGTGNVASPDFVTFANNWVTPYSTQNFSATTFLQGNANRYYRANETGLFAQDKFQVTPTLSITAGVRYDWDGGLTEKYGNIFNFDPKQYSYDVASDTITSSGFIIAGNNANGTKGVSDTTLTGRQWGIAPRLGLAWQPSMFHSKIVVRGGGGFYYDRGELFTYLSPGYAAGEVDGGPFGSSQTEPFVSQQHCQYSSSFNAANPTYLYLNYLPICGGGYGEFGTGYNGAGGYVDNRGYNLSTPWGPSRSAPPSNPKASDIANYLPNAASLIDGTVYSNNSDQPYTLGIYNRTNKLPYSINFTLNIQYQPRNDLMIEIGYVGNLGRHQVIPVPFNQAQIATLANPTHPGGTAAQYFSYGYTVLDPNTFYPQCVNDPTEVNCSYGTMLNNYEGGNVDLRVPYIGYSSESESYTAAGIAAYHALESHLEKRFSHGFQAGVSYTYSHATDEQSGLGLFYNGNNPTKLRSGYGSADFDRTHVLNFTYGVTSPKVFATDTLAGKALDSWSLHGVAVIQSGQPYSVIDYSGAVGSIFYSTFNGITNPILALAPGCSKKSAVTGQSGAFYNPTTGANAALKATCFQIPLIPVGTMGVPAGDPYETNFTSGERNIFRQSWQRRADASLEKELPIHDQWNLRYTFDVYNLTNTTSFDIPQNNVNQNVLFNNVPTGGTTPLPTNDCASNPHGANSGFYNCPVGLGVTRHAIGSPRQIQMSLHLDF
ncbi:MAG: carboxypeptidase regulatory-like domain-containing protein [Terracidiphilus sp.]